MDPSIHAALALLARAASRAAGHASGLGGNLEGEFTADALRSFAGVVAARLRAGEPVVNHDVQRAVRRAYLLATVTAAEAHGERARGRGDSNPSRWAGGVREWAAGELRELERPDFAPPANPADARVALLLDPPSAGELASRLEASLIDEVIRELSTVSGVGGNRPVPYPVPAGFESTLRDGWTVGADRSSGLRRTLRRLWRGAGGRTAGPVNDAGTVRWYEVLCAHFADQLKRDGPTARIFDAKLLAELHQRGGAVTPEQLRDAIENAARAAGAPALARLHEIHAELAALRGDQRAKFDALQGGIDILVASLTAHADAEARAAHLGAYLQEAIARIDATTRSTHELVREIHARGAGAAPRPIRGLPAKPASYGRDRQIGRLVEQLLWTARGRA